MSGDHDADATGRARGALRQAVYYLDRGLASGQKVRAFTNAEKVIEELPLDELESRVADATITELAGIGRSTGQVITDAVKAQPSAYLTRLDAGTACPPLEGAEVRSLLRGDLHCHTTWSDGGAPVRDMVGTAVDLGHQHMAITDHSPRLTIAHGLSVERLTQQLDEIDSIRAEFAPFRILTGMEVDILGDGGLDLPDEALGRLDVVVASVHSKLRMGRKEMTERMARAVSSPHVDILGHCTGRRILGTGRAPSEFDADVVFSACARYNTAVEVNCRPDRRDPPEELMIAAAGWDCLFAIDTDAHAPGQMEWQNWGCDLVARLGIPATSIINTWDADELLAWTEMPTGP